MYLLSFRSKKIPKDDLFKLMPLTWLTNYEKEHAASRPVHIPQPLTSSPFQMEQSKPFSNIQKRNNKSPLKKSSKEQQTHPPTPPSINP